MKIPNLKVRGRMHLNEYCAILFNLLKWILILVSFSLILHLALERFFPPKGKTNATEHSENFIQALL
jgi:hypothetical protein